MTGCKYYWTVTRSLREAGREGHCPASPHFEHQCVYCRDDVIATAGTVNTVSRFTPLRITVAMIAATLASSCGGRKSAAPPRPRPVGSATAAGSSPSTSPASPEGRAPNGQPGIRSVPNVIGQDYWDAEIMLEADGFVAKIAYRSSTDFVLDKAIDQVLVVRRPDDPVQLWVSSGPGARSVLLPNVLRLTENVATRELESSGFQVHVERRSTFTETDDGKVLDESPSSLGAPSESTVVLTVGQYRP